MKIKNAWPLMVWVLGMATIAFAETAAPAVGTGFLATLQGLIAKIPTSGSIVVAGSFVVELLMRAFPSQKPISILYFIRNLLVYLAAAFQAIGKLLDGWLQNAPQGSSNPPPQI